MATSPSTTSPRASYQRVVARPVASISCTRHVKYVPSAELQCGSMRAASQNSPITAPSSTITQNAVTIGHQHARRLPLLLAAAVALAGVLAACSGGGGSTQAATTSAPAPPAGVPIGPTEAPTPTPPPRAPGPADLGSPAVVAAQTSSAGGIGALDPSLQTQITDAVHTYV